MRIFVSALGLIWLGILAGMVGTMPAAAADDATAGAAPNSAPSASPDSAPAASPDSAPSASPDSTSTAAPATPAAPAGTEAPFGLKWGMHVGDLSGMGIKVASTTNTGNVEVVNVKEIPNAFPDTNVVNMLFDRTLGLVKVRWTSVAIADDPTGSKGRSKYGEMKKSVVEARGNPSDETLVVGARLFDQEDEFYQCLAYEGCGVWSALWEQAPSGGVLLSIEGLGPGQGYVQLDFESADWQKASGGAK